jgi:type IV pilus assembly protein PilY1
MGTGVTTETGCGDNTNKRVWPLGDIIFSTPTLVSVPGERFSTIYGDQSYLAFANTYKKRRSMIYVGANDGQLHAFNGGVYYDGDKPSTSAKIEMGWFDANAEAAVNGWGNAKIGDELWSFVPHDNLPHLAWLACTGTSSDPTVCGDDDYTHVYYVDQRPKATDARIFNDGATGISGMVDGQDGVSHPHGWGTLLIVPMRLGGGAMDVTISAQNRSFRSAVYVFDVTDPEKKPKLLWRFSHADLGFTTSYPSIVRINNGAGGTPGMGEWFMIMGSGPKNNVGDRDLNRDYNFIGNSTITQPLGQPGRVFVVDLKTGALRRTFTPVAANGIMGDPTVVDADLDFTADVIYIGAAIEGTAGRIFRINTKQDVSPANWTMSTLFDPDPNSFNANPGLPLAAPADMGPLFVGPSVSKDIAGNLWVFFGTGRLKNTADISNSHQQRFYGIKDGCWNNLTEVSCVGPNNLNPDSLVTAANNYAYTWNHLYNAGAVKVTTATGSATQVEAPTAICPGGACSYQTLLSYARSKKGWYTNVGTTADTMGERVLARSSILGGLLMFTAYKPAGDICSIFGNSNLYALYYETGTPYLKPVVPGAQGVFTENGKEYVKGVIDIGAGMPTSVGIAVGETISGFVQKSTGEIIRIEAQPGLGVRSGFGSWRETNDGGGSVGIETIYKHIVK